MELDGHDLPQEYVDIVAQQFAYDPIKLPSAEDPSQVLYNRRTLETIWDTKQDALNPFTRQPFHIRNAIPQTELKQEMYQYILNNRNVALSLGLQVIPDYTQVLNETEMKQLLTELVFAGNHCLRRLKKMKRRRGRRNRNRKLIDKELERWNAFWKKLNLVRLYCQYRAENREVFSSIEGYKYFFQVINKELTRYYSGSSCHDDAKEVGKEVARIVDVMGGLKDKDLLMAPEGSVLAFVLTLFDLRYSGCLKMQSMALRIYRGMFEDCFDYLARCKRFRISYMVQFTLWVLSDLENGKEVVNEDLYNGMTILKAAWIRSVFHFRGPYCVRVIFILVTVCTSRLQELHDAVTAHQAWTVSRSGSHQVDHEDAMVSSSNISTTGHEDHDHGELEKNIHLISMGLEQGLFLIYSMLTFPPHTEEEADSYMSRKETLERMDIVKQIVRIVELVIAWNKFFKPSHLGFGLKIIAALYEEGSLSRMIKPEFVRVFGDFLQSKYVDEYGSEIKQLVQNIVRGPTLACI